jgi:hypothetical protein
MQKTRLRLTGRLESVVLGMPFRFLPPPVSDPKPEEVS